MGAEITAVDWYRSCISERQRRANSLNIEVQLIARERDDAGALAEAMECLDSAIRGLEVAKEKLTVDDRPRRVPRPIANAGPLMEDLGHSMTALPVPALPTPGLHRARNGNDRRRHALDPNRFPFENSLSFFQ